MKTIALYNIKGGVGKTAACVNLAHLAASGQATALLCDLDSQGSSSFYFRVRPKSGHSAHTLLKGKKGLDHAIRESDYPGLDLLPSDPSYRHLEIRLNELSGSRRRLKRLLVRFRKRYDYIFLDCPPNITLVSENVFEAADLILVPLVPTTLSRLAYLKLERFFKKNGLATARLRPFLSMVEPRKRMHRQMIREITADTANLLATRIPYSADIEKMGLLRAPLTHCLPASKGAAAFAALWREIRMTALTDDPERCPPVPRG